VAGARAVQESILERFPASDIRLSLIWIEILPTDSLAAAERMAAGMSDSRVQHYFDPRETHLAGQALARGIIREGGGPAWDVYLFFDREARWDDVPPLPIDWCHQLSGGQRADPTRFAGGVVAERLHESMHALTATDCSHGESGG
jgi:hypothetical protein